VPELEGNGGSLQVALAFDIPIGESPEIDNPTEAGNHRDSYGKTSSKWIEAAASSTEAYTKSQLAYYYPPGEPVASSSSKTKARGTGLLSDVIMEKRVTVGWRYANVINFAISLRWTKEHWFTQVQILAVYLARDFKTVYLVGANGAPTRHDTGNPSDIVKISPPRVSQPIIIAKSQDVAVGLYAHKCPPGRFPTGMQPWYTGNVNSAGHKDFGKGLREVQLSTITAVWHAGDPANSRVRIAKSVSFECALVLGSVANVAATIQKLRMS
jgi:hypothetical protein